MFGAFGCVAVFVVGFFGCFTRCCFYYLLFVVPFVRVDLLSLNDALAGPGGFAWL